MSAFIIGLIRLYQLCARPFLGARCRFYPSCSDYAAEAVASRGALVGIWITAARLSRCHPFHPGGYDPLPKHG